MKLMKTLPWLALALGALACQREDKVTKDRLDKMTAQAEDIEKKVDKVGQGRGAMAANAPQPGRPDPTAIYSVPIDGNPMMGPAAAKVTIVEAAEFA